MVEANFKTMLFGGDYNPEQWPEEIWLEDMQILKQAAINSATINVFSWALLQPSENEYDFTMLDKIVAILEKNHYQIILATATAALPGWMARRYPDVNRTDFNGQVHKFGVRHNACPNSPTFRKYSPLLANKLAARYGQSKNLVCWHISNEYEGECFCENCAKAFRVWVKAKYQTIEVVNDAWNMNFWGHTLYDWEDIVPPNCLADGFGTDRGVFPGLSIDYKRFMSDSLLQNYRDEKAAIRQFDSKTPITTNMMGTYKGLDYFKWAKELDIISWDNYPDLSTPVSLTAMTHDLMRGLKNGQPFMLMEQTPSQQNAQMYSWLKKPGQMRSLSYQAVAHGADTVQFFQLRRSKGATEKFHGAVIDHSGTTNTRVFRETAQLGHELAALGNTLMGARHHSKVALVFDWENYWALEYSIGPTFSLKYVGQIHQYYAAFYRQNISVDLIPLDADFSKYDLVVAPVLYMVKEGVDEAIRRYVKQGGTFVTTFMSGMVNQSDNIHLGGYPGPLRDILGIWVEEMDALPPEERYPIEFSDQTIAECRMLCSIVHLEGAQVKASYGAGKFYEKTPVVTTHQFGRGQAVYVGSMLVESALDHLVTEWAEMFALEKYDTPKDIEITTRYQENQAYVFVINHTPEVVKVALPFEETLDLLTNEVVLKEIELKPFGVKILQK